jgi:hypothetical protein
MATPSPSASPASVVHSHLSKGASIGIGVGLTVGVLILIAGMLWLFSFHKRYDEDSEVEIGPNDMDYRRKGSNRSAPPRPPTGQTSGSGSVPLPARSSSIKSTDIPADISHAQAATHAMMTSMDYDEQKKREGFF